MGVVVNVNVVDMFLVFREFIVLLGYIGWDRRVGFDFSFVFDCFWFFCLFFSNIGSFVILKIIFCWDINIIINNNSSYRGRNKYINISCIC